MDFLLPYKCGPDDFEFILDYRLDGELWHVSCRIITKYDLTPAGVVSAVDLLAINKALNADDGIELTGPDWKHVLDDYDATGDFWKQAMILVALIEQASTMKPADA